MQPFLLLLLAGCGSDASTEKPTEEPTVILLPEDLAVVRTQSISTGPRISGTLTAAETAALRAESAGSVVGLSAEIGDRVEKGAVLAKIESQVASSAYVSTQSAVVSATQDASNARREIERVRRLAEAGALSPHDVEAAEAGLAAAEARLAGAKAQDAQMGEQVGNTTVRSPIDGIVSERAVGLGDIVAPGTPLFTVIEPSSLRLEGAVPAASATTLAIGTPVKFEVQGFEGKPFDGTIERISPAVDPMTRQIPILVSIPNPEGKLLAGLFAEGRVATETHEGLVVPAGAVDLAGLRPSVLRVKDGAIELVEIDVGIHDTEGELIEATSGLQQGDQIVLQGKGDVKAGARVELRQENATTTPASADASASAER
jgi:membrane fusion protein, multidrug efflux system